MKTALKLFPTLVLAAGISVALAFGAKEASACATCTPPPPTACLHKIDPNLFCRDLCINDQECTTGECAPGPDRCVCPF